jgi:hypothetical protein
MSAKEMVHLVAADGLTYVDTMRLPSNWMIGCKRIVDVMPDGRHRVFDLQSRLYGSVIMRYIGTVKS